ncbi:type III-B CRISPR-associated protein Cas10/Cmr2 [Bacillus sp. HMF5848]|uniref:type III-B CRISPR-associated protein Cas10/Cmr2 n=1 Tax=Bacillus sp. HMF5848 TaxID=2495421 RepID=UPI000F78081A|nr:type III-B CRISPR-associated protein Cas10/Cmr2 [Bacillus sp. HMF5848]RSK26555.1 type III-B CRISPR-associated protein Cas10/Cmr2 [Bacillus sp. HMF5848]
MNKECLLLVSIGPVQSFIASARKVEDLWSGSYLLSYLVKKAILSLFDNAEIEDIEVEMIYPSQNRQTLNELSQGELVETPSLPNRFICKVKASEEKTAALAKQIETKVQNELYYLCKAAIDEKVFTSSQVKKDLMIKLMEEQVNSFLEVFWTVELLENEKNYELARTRIEKRLAAIKNNRPIKQVVQDGLVCTVCGDREALHEHEYEENDRIGKMKNSLKATWDKRSNLYKGNKDNVGRIRDNEALCSICLGKRVARDYFKVIREVGTKYFKSFPPIREIAEEETYYAIIMMDGDDMGQWFSGKKGDANGVSILNQQRISKRLEIFSKQVVPELVKEYKGKLIYSGGDDVLAFVPLHYALLLAKKLRQAFSSEDKGLGELATASIGMVVAHQKAPLGQLLTYTRKLEKKAKTYKHPISYNEKDALALSVFTHSGEVREVTLPWLLDGNVKNTNESNWSIDRLIDIIDLLNNELSSTFLYTFAQEFLPLIGSQYDRKLSVFEYDKSLNEDLFMCEMKRLIDRAKVNYEIKTNDYAECMLQLHKLVSSTLQFIHLLEILRFFNRKR